MQEAISARFSKRPKWKPLLALVVALVIIGGVAAGAGFAMFGGSSAQAKQVTVRDRDGALIATAAPSDAIGEASARLGFDLRVPSNFPTNAVDLINVVADTGPTGVQAALHIGMLEFSDGTTTATAATLELYELPVRLDSPGGAAYDTGRPDMQLFATGLGTPRESFTLLTKDRTFTATFTNQVPAKDALAGFFLSLHPDVALTVVPTTAK
ncbi:MAG: hypothetical protein ACRDG3_00045 [Tepidiformaceae bacterium]